MIWSVYLIKHLPTGKSYVGRSFKIKARWTCHRSTLKHGKHHNAGLQEAWSLGKPEDFQFVVVKDDLSDSDSQALEERMIEEGVQDGSVFNICLGSIGGDTLTAHPHREEVCRNRSNATRERMATMSVEDRKATYGLPGSRNGMYGRTHGKSARSAISKALIGNQFARGAVRSDEVKQAISERAKKRVGPKNPFFGRSHTSKSKRRMSEANKGKKPSNRRSVLVGSDRYGSVLDASRSLGISSSLVIYRIKSLKYTEYSYVSEEL